MRHNITVGPFIIFHRYHERNKTCILGDDKKVTPSIKGYDTNVFSLLGLKKKKMPCDFPVVRRKEDTFKAQQASCHPEPLVVKLGIWLEGIFICRSNVMATRWLWVSVCFASMAWIVPTEPPISSVNVCSKGTPISRSPKIDNTTQRPTLLVWWNVTSMYRMT